MHATSTVVTLIIHNCRSTMMAVLSSCVLQTGSFYLKEPATLFIKNTHRWNIMCLIRAQFEMTCMGGDCYSNFSTKHSCSRVKTAITLIKEKWFRASGDSQKTAHLNFFQYNIYVLYNTADYWCKICGYKFKFWTCWDVIYNYSINILTVVIHTPTGFRVYRATWFLNYFSGKKNTNKKKPLFFFPPVCTLS